MTKPPAEKRVLAWDGKQWVRAIWVEKHTKEQDTDSEFHDYREADDTYYWPEGWYEVQTHGGEAMFWHITDGVQEWRDMPPAPAADHVPDAGEKVGQDCPPVLVRDLAEILGRAVPDVMSAFIVAGLAPHSPNMAVSGEDALAVAAVLKQQRHDCEPDAWMDADGDLYATEPDKHWCPPHTPLYAAPPKREPLSEDQFKTEWHRRTGRICGTDIGLLLQAKYVTEVAHGIRVKS